MMFTKEKKNKLSPLLKYPGGKEKELKFIVPNLPKNTKQYYEPFIGGGATYLALDSDKYYINDKSTELINLYNMIKSKNDVFFKKLNSIDTCWNNIDKIIAKHKEDCISMYLEYKNNLINEAQLTHSITEFLSDHSTEFTELLEQNFNIAIDEFILELNKSLNNKFRRMKKLEIKNGSLKCDDLVLNIECAFKNAFYMYIRYLYNHTNELKICTPFATAIYFYIREFCYSSMFRYNKQGEFNVPYGGISYNKKSISKKIQYFSSHQLIEQLQKTVIENIDFEDFLKKYSPQNDDFIFLDPPYDTEFSTYAQNEFQKNDQIRLANYLIKECRANFMLIIKNTDFIRNLYLPNQLTANGNKIYVNKFDKNYVVSFQDRNDKKTEHLLITNYEIKLK